MRDNPLYKVHSSLPTLPFSLVLRKLIIMYSHGNKIFKLSSLNRFRHNSSVPIAGEEACLTSMAGFWSLLKTGLTK